MAPKIHHQNRGCTLVQVKRNTASYLASAGLHLQDEYWEYRQPSANATAWRRVDNLWVMLTMVILIVRFVIGVFAQRGCWRISSISETLRLLVDFPLKTVVFK